MAKKGSKPKAKKAARPAAKRAVAVQRKAPRSTSKTRAAPAAARPPPAKNPMAARMAAFSEKVLAEEEAPVAVRSFTEARAGSAGSKQLLPKTGAVTPAPQPLETTGSEEPAPDEPRMEPMSGRLAVPKPRDADFDVAAPAPRKGRAAKVETPDEFGPVELRQATATGGRHITRSNPENLQKAANRIQPLASPDDSSKKTAKAKPERFDVAMPTRTGTRPPEAPTSGPAAPDLSDWGDIEIGQQTLSGSRRIGKLKKDEAP